MASLLTEWGISRASDERNRGAHRLFDLVPDPPGWVIGLHPERRASPAKDSIIEEAGRPKIIPADR
jgi:hypothetical protein